jgi:hypothetical protein
MLGLVVGGDSNINVLEGGISVSKRDDRDVDIRGFKNSLEVSARIGTDDQTGLAERAGDVIGEGTGGETTDDGLSTNVLGELEGGTVTVRTGRDNNNILGLKLHKISLSVYNLVINITYVLDGGNDTGSENELLPGLTNVDQVDTFIIKNVGIYYSCKKKEKTYHQHGACGRKWPWPW